MIIPCHNELEAAEKVVEELQHQIAAIGRVEIILITDGTTEILRSLECKSSTIKLLEHIGNFGYGAALKTGIRHARGQIMAITDADGSYPNERIPDLLALCKHADMVVGA